MSSINTPHGGELKIAYLPQDEIAAHKLVANEMLSWDLSHRQLCDIELLLSGAFSPLEGFMSESDYQSVVDDLRLADGTLWPMPINLDVHEKFAEKISVGTKIALRDEEGVIVATLAISDVWKPNKKNEAKKVYATDCISHPGVDYLFNQANAIYLGGKLTGLEKINHYDFKGLRNTPAELREQFIKLGWKKIVAFQTRNPMHRAHHELTFRAAKQVEANLLIQPVVGMTKPGDVDHYSRVRCYEHVLSEYPEQTTMLSLLPLAMRMAGPREAVWHAIIRKNYGCSHFIVGRDHAGPGQDANGKDFYGAYEAQQLMQKYGDELAIEMVPFQMMVYVEDKAEYQPIDDVKKGLSVLNISGTEFRRRLEQGLEIPAWFSYPKVVEELRKRYPARHQQGLTLFFTGLSGSGKSTIANALLVKLMEQGQRSITLLDGDLVRKHLSSELGFSKEHRNLNIERIGYVASEITKNGGIAICAPIAPYEQTRQKVRQMIKPYGGFMEIHVSTSLEVCESRDRKGLYALARKGIIKEFTGISDPYEIPTNPELTINTLECSPDEAAMRILLKLEAMGYIK